VNSLSHIWGYRTHDTPDNSRNNPLVAFLAWGEGWHNNHHADPVSPRHGRAWWELDMSWLAIRGLMALGLAWPRGRAD
jgi:fatty-acid desaturase